MGTLQEGVFAATLKITVCKQDDCGVVRKGSSKDASLDTKKSIIQNKNKKKHKTWKHDVTCSNY
jgi:hypothetical protein